jgi:phosphatidylserine/phosphatidylglycerophosphate/cardiolipin synthase-like enzyme
LETIASSQQRLFLVSFVAFEVESVSQELVAAISRGVLISILLERPKSQGGNVDVDSLSAMRRSAPGAQLYIWADAVLAGGSMHAKCAVADEGIAFITSANLTRAALERNIELGILIRGGDVPRDLHRHLEGLVATKKLSPA